MSKNTKKNKKSDSLIDRARRLLRRGFTTSSVLVAIPGITTQTVAAIKANISRSINGPNKKKAVRKAVRAVKAVRLANRRKIDSNTTVDQVWDAAVLRFERGEQTLAARRSQAAKKAWRTRQAAR
jgi:hypothetical protein